MILKTIKFAFWNTFDHFFFSFILNFSWFFLHAGVILVYSFVRYDPKFSHYFPDIFNYLNSPATHQFLTATIAGKSVSLLKPLHSFLLYIIFLLFSPFSMAVFAMNHRLSKRLEVNAGEYFKALKKYFFKSTFLMILNFILIIILFSNIYFYQNLFKSHLFLYYLTTIATLLLVFIYFVATMFFIPLFVSEQKGVIDTFKRSFYIAITSLGQGVFVFLALLLVIGLSMFPHFMILLIFFFPVFFGQFIYENYITCTEQYGNKRTYEENRSLKDFVFPWRTNR